MFSIAGRISTHARRIHLKLSKNATCSTLVVTALTPLTALPAPAVPQFTRPDDAERTSASGRGSERCRSTSVPPSCANGLETQSRPAQTSTSPARKIEVSYVHYMINS
ncbi:hypothetical protein J7E74_13680 [Rhodococcus erythropolis]|nr:hypothetical protein [Rhodococcus erythropolis]